MKDYKLILACDIREDKREEVAFNFMSWYHVLPHEDNMQKAIILQNGLMSEMLRTPLEKMKKHRRDDLVLV